MRTDLFLSLIIGLLLLASCGPEVDQSSTPDEIAALAQRKLEEGELQRALELFETALEGQAANPDAPLWEIARGEILLYMGNPSRAITISSAHSSSQDPVVRNRALLLGAMAQSHSSPGSALGSWPVSTLSCLTPTGPVSPLISAGNSWRTSERRTCQVQEHRLVRALCPPGTGDTRRQVRGHRKGGSLRFRDRQDVSRCPRNVRKTGDRRG